MERYPLVSPKNLPAYAAVMGTWLVISAALAAGLRWLTNASLPWASAVGFAAVAVMLGMSIMFVASVVNLRKLRPGFERLADGAADPEIPRCGAPCSPWPPARPSTSVRAWPLTRCPNRS